MLLEKLVQKADALNGFFRVRYLPGNGNHRWLVAFCLNNPDDKEMINLSEFSDKLEDALDKLFVKMERVSQYKPTH